MFTSKGLFSEVSCPYQKECLLPRCIFWHPDGPLQSLSTVTNSENIDLVEDENQPRKRQKLGGENQKPTTDGLASQKENDKITGLNKFTGSSVQVPRTNATAHGKTTRRVHDSERPISPPPLRQNLQNTVTAPVTQSLSENTNNKSSLKTPTSKVASTPIKSSVKVPLKQEALNPRFLKGPSPAKHDIRYRLLKMLHEQFDRLNSELARDANEDEEKLILSEQELITKALDLEESAAGTPTIYSNVVKNKIMVYKKMIVPQWKEERARELAQLKAKEIASISDTPVSKPMQPPKIIETGLSPKEELTLLHRLYTPITGLVKHGYVTTIPTDAEIATAEQGVEAAQGWEVCDRCKSRFQVFPGRREDGTLASGGTCTYHFGKPYWPERSAGDPKAKRERKYRCCNQAMGDSTGCTQAENHVFKITEVKRMASILNFEKTPENPDRISAAPVCIDGEMGYTVYGLELIRLTATSWPNGEELFDVLVRPIGEVLDLNSRYSGVWPKDMVDTIPYDSTAKSEISDTPKRQLRIVASPSAARTLLFSFLAPNTPLIGHGLENDLNATRLIHPTIIDTALLFPHKAGLPYRNGLKMLMQMHLNRQIQVVLDGKMEGHDSKEDANAAGELVRFKVAGEWAKMKREGWKLEKGELIAPLPKDSALGMAAQSDPKEMSGSLRLGSESAGKKRSREEMEAEEGEVTE